MDRALSLPLADLRVIDMADEKGEMCGRFLADLMPAAERWAGEILECSPLSVRLTKESALDGLQHSVDDALARDHGRIARLLASADFVEGPKAFSEKRRPQWTGR